MKIDSQSPQKEEPNQEFLRRVGSRFERFDEAYTNNDAPWDINKAQDAIATLFQAGKIKGKVLDIGCGSGEHCFLAAERGLQVIGLDYVPKAIAMARVKAKKLGLEAHCEFEVADALAEDFAWRNFDCVIDCGLFHTFSDDNRLRYVKNLHQALRKNGVLFLMCFSDLTPGDEGPRRVSKSELQESFALENGWHIREISKTKFETNKTDWQVVAWLAEIIKT